MQWLQQFRVYPLLLLLVGSGLYFSGLHGDFIYDSRSQVLVDPFIHESGRLKELLTLQVLSEDVLDQGRPVHLLSLMMDSAIWGRNPFGYRLTNLLIHLANTLLLFHLLQKWLRLCHEEALNVFYNPKVEANQRDKWSLVAFVGALLFCIHPIQVETISEVSYREDLLSTLFMLLAFSFISGFWGRPGLGGKLCGLMSVICLFLSVASKENGVAGPFLLMLFWFLFQRIDRRLPWFWLIAFASFVVMAYLYFRFALQPESSVRPEKAQWLDQNLFQTLKVAPRIWVLGLQNLVLPMHLCADYGPLFIRGIRLDVSIALILVIIGSILWFWKKYSWIAWGSGWFILTCLPVSNLIPIFVPIADHFFYLPMVGVSILVTGWLGEIKTEWYRYFWIGVSFVILGGLSILSERQITAWKDRENLWETTLTLNPMSWVAANNLGFALYDKGDPTDAIQYWSKSISLTHERHPDPWAGMAIGLYALGRTPEAQKAIEKAIRLDSRYAQPDTLLKALIWEPSQVDALKKLLKEHSQGE